MIGRVYRLRGEYWRVLVRWRNPEDELPTAVCATCGEMRPGGVWVDVTSRGGAHLCPVGGEPHEVRFVGGHGKAVRNVLLARVESTGLTFRDHEGNPQPVWRDTGERTVRPFRGLRRVPVRLSA